MGGGGSVDEFKKACRDKRYAPRDFEYSEDAHKKLVAQREQVNEAVNRQHGNIKGLYRAAWSDAMVAWMHIKAMRIFVESVLRHGMPPKFAAFILSPSKAESARKSLNDIIGTAGHGGPHDKNAEKEEGDDEFFTYVSLSFVPFTVPRGK